MEKVILNKIESIERCVRRIEEIYNNDESRLDDFLYQDALTLNIQRACQQAIDLSMYICSKMALGIPKRSRDSFSILEKAKIITKKTSLNMGLMVGFRNIVIHEYQDVETDVIKSIAEDSKKDFLVYTKEILVFLASSYKQSDN